MEIVKPQNNHFVPQFYLKNFRNEDLKIFLFNKNTRKHTTKEGTKHICAEKDLYTLKEKISKNDENFFFENINKNTSKEFISKLSNFLNDSSTNHYTQEELFTFYEFYFVEKYYSIIKEGKLPLFEKDFNILPSEFLFKKINLFFENKKKDEKEVIIKNDYYDFLYYILIQSFRSIDIYKTQDETTKNFKALFIHSQLPYILDTMVKENFKLSLIKNETNENFITSDNPVINTFSHKSGKYIQTDKTELYFPLSPSYALIYKKESIYKQNQDENFEITITKPSEILHFNKIIFNTSKKFIYAKDKEDIQKIINSNQNNNIKEYITKEKQR